MGVLLLYSDLAHAYQLLAASREQAAGLRPTADRPLALKPGLSDEGQQLSAVRSAGYAAGVAAAYNKSSQPLHDLLQFVIVKLTVAAEREKFERVWRSCSPDEQAQLCELHHGSKLPDFCVSLMAAEFGGDDEPLSATRPSSFLMFARGKCR